MARLLTVEDLLETCRKHERAMRQKYGNPRPLHHFALQGEVHDGLHANALMDSLDATVFEDIGTAQWRSARWFLLESEMFFDYCAFAGIDGQRWRRHLRRVCRVVDHQKELVAATQKEGGRR